jgi:tetratricopeptide (TPR) repeat protein
MKKIKFINLLFCLTLLIILLQTNYAQENNNVKYLLINGNYQEIVNILEGKLFKEDSLSFSELNTLGIAYQNLMNFSKATTAFYKASILKPENTYNLLLLANSFASLGNNNSAKITYDKILELNPENLIAMINLGKILIELDEFNSASKLYTKMISSDSSNSYYYSQLGICELEKGNRALAKQCFEESLQIDNTNVKTVLRLAKLYYKDEQYSEAANLLKEGLTQNSKNKSLNKMLADVFYKNKQYEEAIIKYLYTITIGDTSAQIYQKLGLTYYYLSFNSTYKQPEVRELKLNEAIEAFQKSYLKDTDDPITTLYLGLCYKEIRNYDKSINYLEETLKKVFPEYIGEIYSNLGISYGATKNYIESIKAYKEALQYNSEKRTLHFYLANIYDNYYADKSVAVLYYKKFVDENTDADENLIGYSLNRIKALTQEAEFWGK